MVVILHEMIKRYYKARVIMFQGYLDFEPFSRNFAYREFFERIGLDLAFKKRTFTFIRISNSSRTKKSRVQIRKA